MYDNPNYPKSTPKQRAHLIYGTKLRYLKGLSGYVQTTRKQHDIFTAEEEAAIEEIVRNAQNRAQKERDDALRRLDTVTTETDSGIASESREYNGK